MGKKHKCPEFENHERWLVSFADMLTLLFATFVVLYALNLDQASSDDEKLAGSMQEAFNKPLEDIPLDARSGDPNLGWGVLESMLGNSLAPQDLSNMASQEEMLQQLGQEVTMLRQMIENRLYGPDRLRSEKGDTGLERIVSIHPTARGVRVRLAARHFYGPGELEVKRSAKRELSAVAASLKELGRQVTVEGHTDNQAGRGGYNNWEISALRASNVLQYLIKEHNFPPLKLAAAGYAGIHPIASNGTEEGRALNRRIEILIHYDKDTLLYSE